jgi:hypothetical protein
MANKEISLMGLADGAAEEMFQVELGRVLANIEDANTSAEGERSITLKVSFFPNAERNRLDVDVAFKTKLEPNRSCGTVAYVGKNALGKTVAVENNPKQDMFDFGNENGLPTIGMKQTA